MNEHLSIADSDESDWRSILVWNLLHLVDSETVSEPFVAVVDAIVNGSAQHKQLLQAAVKILSATPGQSSAPRRRNQSAGPLTNRAKRRLAFGRMQAALFCRDQSCAAQSVLSGEWSKEAGTSPPDSEMKEF